MNQQGNLIFFILVAFIVLAIIPPIIMIIFPLADIIIRIILALMIFMMVRGYLGDGVPTLVVAGVLIYFLVIKWAYFTASAYVLYFLLGLSFLSVIIWGIGMNLRK